MPAVPAFLIEPIWDQFQVLNPEVVDAHPLGCDRPRVDNRIVFDKVIQILVPGCAYEKIADSTCSAATIRRRRDEWITAGVFVRLEQIALWTATTTSPSPTPSSPSDDSSETAGPVTAGTDDPITNPDLMTQSLTR